MRKMLTATIVAMVLFAVGAFAATFDFNADDVASGVDEVKSCTSSVQTTFTTPYVTPASGNPFYEVTEVILGLPTGNTCGGVGATPDPATVSIRLMKADGTLLTAAVVTQTMTSADVADGHRSRLGHRQRR